ncbi:asparagine synthase B [Litorilinea aerophila]|uniref:asparagine synthase (glutamine-hydrolyzing) n=1 Tax=Litorilinea aerophila TaxID=1204385 RepID=A0A540VMR3_9CHLR|nr:asparagine synthase B [Litorilinea aerophila]MCC9074695.1 asparagine synthase B [Litorilinea aerophila]
MCGIAGMWGDVDETLLQAMLSKIAHRGPDGQGIALESSQGALAHCRLAIMDPAGGDQPIYNEDRSRVLVANGEIYNFPALRTALSNRHRFRSRSDSEAIVHLWEDERSDAVRALDGMFAFVAMDDRSLFLARDPIGIKPLYWGIHQPGAGREILCFASEVKSLANWVDEVAEVPPGTYYDSETGWGEYYQIPEPSPLEDLSPEEHAGRLRAALERAVTKRLMSDVPVGAFLSGGLDSSIIAALARQQVEELHTFSVGIEGSPDIEAARRVARHIGSIHHEYLYTGEEVLAHLPAILYHLESFDQDLVRSAIPCYFCARLASDYVKVILTGEGADELFAGYRYYKEIQDPDLLQEELRRSVSSLHNINLQRVDRMTMCHGIEGRVPFLDTDLIALAQTIPPQLKLKTLADGRQVEKWILRLACQDLLPDDIVWRDKEQFDEGSGTVDLLADLLQPLLAGLDVPAYRAAHADLPLRSAEECLYHKLLAEAFPRPEPVMRTVAHWTADRLAG